MADAQRADPTAETERFPCASCGGDMQYEPGTTHLLCPHCGAEEDVEDTDATPPPLVQEMDYKRALAGLRQAGDLTSDAPPPAPHPCPNCGAEVIFDGASRAGACPYCGTPVVAETSAPHRIKPQGLIPFALAERAAQQAMRQWLGKLWFAPNGLQQHARKAGGLRGVYVPFWTFDAATRSTYSGQRGTDYTVSRTVRRNGKTQVIRQRKTRWRSVAGTVARRFDDLLVLASRSLPKGDTEALAPWELGAVTPYRNDFLAGFNSEAYRVDPEEGFEDAREQMARQIRRDVRRDIGGDRQRIHRVDTDIRDVTFKHILLPVWVAAYSYRGTRYQVVINGQTGRVQGGRPWSIIKIAAALLFAAVIIGTIGYFASQNQ